MESAIELTKREATREEIARMSAHDLFLYDHGVEIYIYGKYLFSLPVECLPKGVNGILRKSIKQEISAG